MSKIIYFTAGPTATAAEIAAIAKLNAIAVEPYEVKVMNSLESTSYGAGIETADLVAGTIPTAYAAVDVIDPDAPPRPDTLPATQAVVNNAEAFVGITSGTYVDTATVTVAAGVVTAIVLS